MARSTDNSVTRRTPNLPLNPTHTRIRRTIQIEHDHAVLAFPLHRRREIQRPLRPDLPMPPQVVAVGPGEAFAEGLHVQEGVGGRADLDGAAVEGGAVDLGGGPAGDLACIVHRQREGLPAYKGARGNIHVKRIFLSGPFVGLPLLRAYPVLLDLGA